MPNVQQVSFQSPGTDYSADLYALQRKQALAEALRAQSMQPIEQQQVNGIPVPISPFQGLNKIMQGATTGMMEKNVERGQRNLAEKSRSELADVLRRGSETLGTDQMGAANIYMQHPMTQGMGLTLAQQSANQTALANALRGVGIGSPQASPQQALNAETAGGGQAGPTNAAAARIGAPNAGIPGVSPYAIPLMASQTPGAADIGKVIQSAYAERGKLQNVRPGGTVFDPEAGKPVFTAPQGGVQTQWGPQGPTASVVPNAQELAARGAGMTAGAQAAGKAPYDLSVVNTPGNPTLMTHQQQIEAATGQPMPSPFALPGAQVPQGATPAVPPGAAPAVPRRAGLTLQDQGQSRAQVEIGEGIGKRFNAIQESGFNANNKINKFSRLGTLLDDINTGKLAPAGFEIAAYAKSLGIPISEKLDNAQAAKAVANDLALELRNPSGGAGMPGSLSNADRDYLSSMVANLDKTPGANKLLVEGSVKLAQRDREVADLARQYKKKHGQFDEGFYDELAKFSDAHPLFTKTAPTVGTGTRATAGQINAPNIDALVNKYAPK